MTAMADTPAVIYPLEGKRVWVAGHRGMVGSALVRRLERENPAEILKVTRQEVDLRDPAAVRAWLETARPEAVFVPAAKVGAFWRMTPILQIFCTTT